MEYTLDAEVNMALDIEVTILVMSLDFENSDRSEFRSRPDLRLIPSLNRNLKKK